MKRTLVILIVVVISQISVFSKSIENANTESDNYITIKGKLTEILNGEQVVLPFANVYLDGTTEVTTTNFDGTFTMKVKEGSYNLKCTYMGYEAYEKEISVSNAGNMNLSILMKSNDVANK